VNLTQLIGALDLGLIYALVALGVLISFRVLRFPDLGVDGTFPLGAAVTAALIISGYDPLFAAGVAFVLGAFSGLFTAWLCTHLRVFNLLSGILTMTALYSINIRIMGGKPNLSLLGEKTIFSQTTSFISEPLLLLLGAAAAILGLALFFHTKVGLSLRAVGINARLAKAQGIREDRMIWLGLGLSNALVALSGSIFAQKYGFADVNMGIGTIIIGLAAVILAEAILPSRRMGIALLAAALGAIFYRLLIALALNIGVFGITASDLNLVTAFLVAAAMLLLKRKLA
jgi:putative ABC transport system permease protein